MLAFCVFYLLIGCRNNLIIFNLQFVQFSLHKNVVESFRVYSCLYFSMIFGFLNIILIYIDVVWVELATQYLTIASEMAADG